MNNVKQIKMAIKREQYMEVVISEEEGYEIPDNMNEFVEFCEDLKSDVVGISEERHNVWSYGEYELLKFDIEEEQ